MFKNEVIVDTKDKGNLKFNSYQEAFEFAQKYCK